MIFETLHESAQRGELLSVDGGMCHWHLRRDGQLTIREIISTKPGAGQAMLAELMSKPAQSIFAKCPADLPAYPYLDISRRNRLRFKRNATKHTLSLEEFPSP
jgi:hypothetical protein